ncbi:MAG: hypothetical protein Q7T82_02735 [Armatimonadota bacterium]|nr:hypothetical protein [Armatimonadota bacterium]
MNWVERALNTEKLWPARVASFIASIVTSIASVAGVVLAVKSTADAKFWYVAISSSVYILCLLVIMGFFMMAAMRDGRRLAERDLTIQMLTEQKDGAAAELQEAEQRISVCRRSFVSMHEVAHLFRDAMAPAFIHDGSATIDDMYFERILDALKSVLDQWTGFDTALSIKLFVDEHKTLRTLCRDGFSKPIRGMDDDENTFKADKNTAFNVIMNGERYFACGDVTVEPHYLNETPNYGKLYRSTIVVPIKFYGGGKKLHYGFLTADWKEADAFDPQTDHLLLGTVSDMIVPLLAEYNRSLGMAQSSPKPISAKVENEEEEILDARKV